MMVVLIPHRPRSTCRRLDLSFYLFKLLDEDPEPRDKVGGGHIAD